MASLLNNDKYSLYSQKIGLLYKRPEVKASLEVILSVFTITILIMVAIRPTLVNITSLQKKIADQETVNKKADNKITQLINADKQLKEFASSLYLYDDAVPDGYKFSDGAGRIEYLAKKNNLKIESLSFSGYNLTGGEATKLDWFSKMAKLDPSNVTIEEVSFTITGKPQGVVDFLKEIENMDRLAILNNVTLAKQTGQTKAEDVLKASGSVRFYFYYIKQ